MSDSAKELGRRLRAGRTAKGWTLRQAAAESGISNGYLSLIEQGEVKAPSPRFLMALANHYGLPYDELMALAGHPSGPMATSAAAQIKSGAHRTAPSQASASGAGHSGAREWTGTGVGSVFGAGRDAIDGDAVAFAVGEDEREAAEVDAVAAGARQPRGESAAGRGEITNEERQQLMALVIDDMRGLTADDIAHVRAFIAGIRATRRR